MKASKGSSVKSAGQRGRWRRGVWLVAALVIVGVAAVVLVPDIGSSQDSGPRLTYRVRRGDLAVSVTEQGPLESAVNTEIKCRIRGKDIPIIWVIESGSRVKKGDELAHLETLEFEERVNNVSKNLFTAQAVLERSRANVARAELAVSEYLEGRYVTELKTMEKDLAIAESELRTARNMHAHAETMADRGYVSDFELEQGSFAVTQADLAVGVKKAEIKALQDYNKAMELQTLQGNLDASKARYEANKVRVASAEVQLALSKQDLEHCVVYAEEDGIVIYPTGKPWEYVPEIEEGATVYMGQTILLMPDLTQMQVAVGIEEEYIDRMEVGLKARVTLPNRTLEGEVSEVADVTGRTGWWNGNKVRYDTKIALPSIPGLQPGMSAEAEILVAHHEDVLTVPVAAIVEGVAGSFCWVKTADGFEQRQIKPGDTNDRFTIVEEGVAEGEEVVLNPLALKEAQAIADEVEQEEAAESAEDGSDGKELGKKSDEKESAGGADTGSVKK